MKVWKLVTSIGATLIAVAGLSSIVQAITIRHDVWDGYYQSLGNNYPSVGRLSIRKNINNFIVPAPCSGTLISPTWVLTAAHCTDGLVSATFEIGGLVYSVIRWIPYPLWNGEESKFNGVDIALMQLNQAVVNVSPASLFTGFNEIGNIGTVVGFGRTGTGITGEIDGSGGTKRGAYNAVDTTGSALNLSDWLLLADFDDPSGSSNSLRIFSSPIPFNLEGSSTSGDSGGALFINGLLAGVVSLKLGINDNNPNASYSDVMGFTRVSVFSNWISSVIGGQRTADRSFFRQIISSANNYSQSFTFAQDVLVEEQPQVVSKPLTLIGLLSVFGLLGLVHCHKPVQSSKRK